MKRISAVQEMHMDAVTSASALQVGDLGQFRAQSRALAVQRQVSVFLENEGDFRQYPLFSRPIPLPVIKEKVHLTIRNDDPYIRADKVRIISAAASSLVHVGSIRHMEMESRVKHIRQFVNILEKKHLSND